MIPGLAFPLALTGKTREVLELIHRIKPCFASEVELAQYSKPDSSAQGRQAHSTLPKPAQLCTCADAVSAPALLFCCSASKSATSLRSKLQSNANSTRGMLFKSALTMTCKAENSLATDTA